MSTTTNPKDPNLNRTDPATGQQRAYLVLPQIEPELNPARLRTRPYRDAYRHTGLGPQYPTRPLTDEEAARHAESRYVVYEPYPPIRAPLQGRFWTQKQLNDAVGCKQVTVLGVSISETYARDPKFYGATFCGHCRKHLPVDQFTWVLDGQRVGS